MKTDTVNRHSASVMRVLDHVLVSRDDSKTIQELSRIARFAPFHFLRVFRSVTGESLQRYIRKLRLDYAVNQLLFTEETIVNVALQAGYQSHEAFTRAFQHTVGVAPSALRASFGVKAQTERNGECVSELSSHLLTRRWSSVPMRYGQLPGGKVIFRSHFGPYRQVPECWRQLCEKARSIGIDLVRAQFVGIMYDHPLKCENVRYDACLAIGPEFRGRSDMGMQVIADAGCVITPHHGPYQLSPYAFIRLMNQCAIQGDRPGLALPYYEIYNDCPPMAGQDVSADIFVVLADKDKKQLSCELHNGHH